MHFYVGPKELLTITRGNCVFQCSEFLAAPRGHCVFQYVMIELLAVPCGHYAFQCAVN